jgi:hypothetical protein
MLANQLNINYFHRVFRQVHVITAFEPERVYPPL